MTGPAPTRGGHPERGAALMLALVLIGVVSVVVGALLSLVVGNLRTSNVAAAQRTQRYSADAAVEQAIEVLRNDRTLCARPGTQPLRTVEVDGITVEVDCTSTSGQAPGAGGWSIVTTATGQPGLTSSAPVTVEGGVWSARLADTYAGLTVYGGHLVERLGAGSCASSSDRPTGVTVAPDPPFRYRCEAGGPPAVDAAPPASAPAAAPAPTTEQGCRVFRPGTYVAAPTFASDNLFVSGTYYFHDIAPLRVPSGAVVIGGERPDEDRVNPGSSACEVVADKLADGTDAPGTGVKWILGGTSWLEVQAGASVELHSRLGGSATEGQMGISLQAVTAPVPSGMAVSTRGLADPLVSVVAGGQLTVHGLVYAPGAFVSHTAKETGPGARAELRGGVYVGRLHLASASGSVVTS